MVSPAIEPLVWTPSLFLRSRALFNDSLAVSLYVQQVWFNRIARSDLMEESVRRRVFLLYCPTRRPAESYLKSEVYYSDCVRRRTR